MRDSDPVLLRKVYKRKIQSDALFHMPKERQYVVESDGTKKCSKCGETKPVNEFHLISSVGERRRGECIKCSSASSTLWAKNNYHRSREIQNASARRSPEKVRARALKKRRDNPDMAAARDLLKRVLQVTGCKKSGKTEAVLGYTAKELRDHIERQFQPGMSWSNRPEWHIDHIVPVNVMIKKGITDPSKINDLSNLRPLWAKDNLSRPHDGS